MRVPTPDVCFELPVRRRQVVHLSGGGALLLVARVIDEKCGQARGCFAERLLQRSFVLEQSRFDAAAKIDLSIENRIQQHACTGSLGHLQCGSLVRR